jgi:hypothetical protein
MDRRFQLLGWVVVKKGEDVCLVYRMRGQVVDARDAAHDALVFPSLHTIVISGTKTDADVPRVLSAALAVLRRERPGKERG